MNHYNFIIDSSAFEKGIGNVKRWQQWLHGPNNNIKQDKDSNGHFHKVVLHLYIPLYTVNELNFQKDRRKSFNARESLKFIDQYMSQYVNTDPFQMDLEFVDLVNVIPWSQVNVDSVESLNKIPIRFKNLLRSCTFKCRMVEDSIKWILITEDPQVKKYANSCNIPIVSITEVESMLAKEIGDKSFAHSIKFNDKLMQNGIKEVDATGKNVIKTNFNKTIYATRGNGKLWKP